MTTESSKIPLTTFSVGSLCAFTYTLQLLLDPNIMNFTLNARSVLFDWEYYRIFTSAFFHGSFSHMAINMFSYIPLGKSLEIRFGTLFLFITILWSIVLTSWTHISMSLLASVFFSEGGNMLNQHSLGFSAVLFHLLVLETKCHPSASYSIFGMIRVESKYYPWLLLLVIQFLMPNVSFIGHLSGIICGNLQSRGMLQCFLPTSHVALLNRWDESRHLQCLTSQPSYIKAPTNPDSFALFSNNNFDTCGGIRSHAVGITHNFIGKFWDTAHDIVISARRGRGTSSDENLMEEQGIALNRDEWMGLSTPTSEESFKHESSMV